MGFSPLEEQRDVQHDQRRARRLGPVRPLAHHCAHLGVNDPGESGPCVGIAKDDVGQRGAVERAVGVDDFGSKGVGNLIEERRSGCLQFADDRIGVDDGRPELGEETRDGALPRPNAT